VILARLVKQAVALVKRDFQPAPSRRVEEICEEIVKSFRVTFKQFNENNLVLLKEIVKTFKDRDKVAALEAIKL